MAYTTSVPRPMAFGNFFSFIYFVITSVIRIFRFIGRPLI